MQLSICITTRNRPQELNACLEALWNSTVQPCSVIVSDDSSDPERQQQTEQVVKRYPSTRYITGPRTGVCGNRNNAVNAVTEGDLVAFVDDDICVEPDFIARALEQYAQLPSQERDCTILTGISRDLDGQALLPGKLSFRGYFYPTDAPESVVIHAAVFPRTFFDQEQWDENIFFGYEDAELCLRALKRGYRILSVPELQVRNICFLKGTLASPSIGNLTDYEIYIEAARLYVGIKRYKHLFPNVSKLLLFISVYFVHLTLYLLKRRSLNGLPEIIKRSRIERLWQRSQWLRAT
ncbi:MAG: glycosyltransferase [Myxacorys californica WJT36-NPBG1]|jgi:GT2 family glycosyltransferase|nr:glycosyltransferase [Myxacorys californica WJT36-NPBG1]